MRVRLVTLALALLTYGALLIAVAPDAGPSGRIHEDVSLAAVRGPDSRRDRGPVGAWTKWRPDGCPRRSRPPARWRSSSTRLSTSTTPTAKPHRRRDVRRAVSRSRHDVRYGSRLGHAATPRRAATRGVRFSTSIPSTATGPRARRNCTTRTTASNCASKSAARTRTCRANFRRRHHRRPA